MLTSDVRVLQEKSDEQPEEDSNVLCDAGWPEVLV